ncbi:MAG: hypothetical protein ACLRSY_03065 [Acutalibacter sp.]
MYADEVTPSMERPSPRRAPPGHQEKYNGENGITPRPSARTWRSGNLLPQGGREEKKKRYTAAERELIQKYARR